MLILLEILFRCLIIVAAVILLTRIHGLRSFSKMSGFDFAITVAFGSVMAGAVTTLSTPIWHFLIALVGLFVVQTVLAQFRARNKSVSNALDNAPMLIMEDGKPIYENLKKGGMTVEDLYAKLREANAINFGNISAVVLESTGDVSVLHGSDDDDPMSDGILTSVNRH